MNDELILQGALANTGGKVSTDEFMDFLSENLNDVDLYQLKPAPGVHMMASMDWATIISTTASALYIAEKIWAAYDKYIKPIRDKNADSDAGLFLQVRDKNGKSYQIMLGKDYKNKETFIVEFEKIARILFKSSNNNGNSEMRTHEISFGKHWVKIERKKNKKLN